MLQKSWRLATPRLTPTCKPLLASKAGVMVFPLYSREIVSFISGLSLGAMQSIGVKNTRAAAEVTAVGAAALTGVMLARKKSVAHRIAYPLLLSGVVCGAFYLSSAQNRTFIRSQIQSGYDNYRKNAKPKK
jgi:hypothetical protein